MRDATIKNRALRRANMTPGVMYGRAQQAMALQFDTAAATRLVREAGTSHLITVSVEGIEATQDAFIRDVQRDPVTGKILHIDLYAVSADQIMTNFVPLVTEGESPAAEEGLIVMQLIESIEVECLPRDMPASIAVDLTKIIDAQSRITVADLAIPENVTVLMNGDAVVVHATMPAEEEEEEAEPEAEVAVEGEEAEEGEATGGDDTDEDEAEK